MRLLQEPGVRNHQLDFSTARVHNRAKLFPVSDNPTVCPIGLSFPHHHPLDRLQREVLVSEAPVRPLDPPLRIGSPHAKSESEDQITLKTPVHRRKTPGGRATDWR